MARSTDSKRERRDEEATRVKLKRVARSPREMNTRWLHFLRWLVEHGRLTDDLVGETDSMPIWSRGGVVGSDMTLKPWRLRFQAAPLSATRHDGWSALNVAEAGIPAVLRPKFWSEVRFMVRTAAYQPGLANPRPTPRAKRNMVTEIAVRDYILPWLILLLAEVAAVAVLAALAHTHSAMVAVSAAQELVDSACAPLDDRYNRPTYVERSPTASVKRGSPSELRLVLPKAYIRWL
jgi:hypothetical protein